jgi:hypothetical protein
MKKQNIIWWVIGIIFILVLLGGAGYLYHLQTKLAVDPFSYQAVFLTNGQVYFGQLTNRHKTYVTLTNVYYLQLKQPLQGQEQSNVNSNDLALVKLGKELHGPTDKMEILRNNILFIEDLSSNSAVLQAIRDYETKK